MTLAALPETSQYLAQLMGPVTLVIGVALLLHPEEYQKIIKELNTSHGMVLLAGTVALVAGTAIVLAHNLWVRDWPLLITLLGWMMILSGLMRLLAPRHVIVWGQRLLSGPNAFRLAGVFYLLLGAALSYSGYFG